MKNKSKSMKNFKVIIALLALVINTSVIAQTKKVAVVTFYADKQVGLKDIGFGAVSLLADLRNDPNFNLTPLLKDFHTSFLNEYSKKFPFELMPETEITGKQEYQNFKPEFESGFDSSRYTTIQGYHPITPNYGKTNTQGMNKIFNTADGTMYVYLTFELVKGFGIGGTATTKMQAYTNIVLYNKAGDKVFTINEHADSKKTGTMVGGIPVMKAEKILPMCQSALEELMKDLDKRIQKIIDKSAKKL